MAEQEIVRIINIKTGEGITSVKDLKKYINELRDSLVVLDKDTDEYKKTVDELTDKQKKLTEVQSAGKSTYTAVGDSIKGLRLQLKALNNTYDELSAADRNSDIGKNLLTQIQAVDKQLKELEGSTGRFQRNVGDYRNALAEVTGEYKSQKAELRELKIALEQLEPGTKEYNEAFMRASEITHNLSEQQEMLKLSSADLGTQLSNIRGIATNVVAGFSAVNAAMALFNRRNEDVEQAMLKVQRIIQLVQGMQGMEGLWKKTTALSTAMKAWVASSKQVTVATNAQTVATKAETVATNAQTVATNTATVATKGLNAALKANPIGVVITAVMALTAIVKPLINLFDKLSGKTKRIAEEGEKAKQRMDEFDESIRNLDRNNRLELIKMRLQGISEVIIAYRQWGQAAEKVNEIQKQLDAEVAIVKNELHTYTKYQRIAQQTLIEWGFSLQEIKDLTENTALSFDKMSSAQKDLVRNNGFKAMVENLLYYVDLVKQAKKVWEDYGDNVEEERLNEEAQARKIADAAKEAFMSESALRKKRYEEDKALLEKYHIDTKYLTAKYYKDLKEIAERNKPQLEPINWDFSAGNFDNIKKQMDDFFNTYQKNSLELLEYQRDTTVKVLNDAKAEEYKYFQDLYNEGRITEEQLANEKKRIDEKYYTVKMQVDEKYRIDYKAEEEKLLEELKEKRIKELNDTLDKTKEKTSKALEDIKAEYNKKFAEDYDSKGKGKNFLSNLLGLDTNDRVKQEQELQDALYQEERNGLERLKEIWEERSKLQGITDEERIDAEKNVIEIMRQLGILDAEYYAENVRRKIEEEEKFKQALQHTLNTAASIFGELSSMYKDDIDEKRKRNEISDKEAENQYEKKVKPLMIAQATISMLQGMVEAFAGAQGLGPIAGPIVGAALATAVGAMGAMNIAKIRATKYNDTGSSSSSSASVPAPNTDYSYTPMYVANTTGQQDTEYLRNSLTEQPIRAYVVESDITESQELSRKRNSESDF